MLKLIKQIPFQLVVSILLAWVLGKVIDLRYISWAYTASSCFIEVLMFALPLIVFSFILKALVNIRSRSFPLVALIFVGVTCSNICALLTSYFLARQPLDF